ncbi:MAG: hypothetical protein LBF81_01285, partial [Prevotellaceae bacterium]|nr:hypothetical protein [Prevotellaceae bacterium]
SGGICCIMHLLLCITLRLGTGSSTTRLGPRRSGRNDGVVGQWAVGSAGAPADLRLMTYDLRLKRCKKEPPV